MAQNSTTWQGRLKHGYAKTYTTTITRYVGPTTATATGAAPNPRGTLPTVATDLNSVFLAPNGSDAGGNGAAGTGTAAAPVLTLAKCILVIAAQPARNTVVIERNGFVGALTFAEGATRILTATTKMQVVLGETATISFGSGNLTLSGTNTINGVYLSSSLTSVSITGNAVVLDNVAILSSVSLTGWGRIDTANITSLTANFSLFGMLDTNTAAGATLTLALTNCVVFKEFNTADPQGAIKIARLNGSTTNITLTRTIIYCQSGAYLKTPNSGIQSNETFQNAPFIILFGGTIATGTVNIICNSSYITGPSKILNITESVTGATVVVTSTLTNSVLKCTNNYDTTRTPNTAIITFTPSEISAIASATPPLYTNEMAFLDAVGPANTVYSLSLQRIGKATVIGSGEYIIDSPLKGAGIAGVDVNPWNESTVLTSSGYTKTTDIQWPASGYNETIRAVNPINLQDVRGNTHTTFDAIRRVFEFTFGGGGIYANNDDMRNLVKLMMDTGSMEFYPRGFASPNLYVDPNTDLPITNNGSFSSTDNSFTPFTPIPMIEGNWRGFWITILSKDYYIESNDSIKLYLVDKRALSFPSNATHNFTIEKILVTPEKGDLQAAQEYFTNFRYGGGFAEQGATTTTKFERSGYTIRFPEIEDDEEPT